MNNYNRLAIAGLVNPTTTPEVALLINELNADEMNHLLAIRTQVGAQQGDGGSSYVVF